MMSVTHLLVLLVTLAIMVAIIGFIAWVIMRLARRSAQAASSIDARLLELAALKAKGLISDTEFAQKRLHILGDL
jgi:flagellar biogenesis protein FliO